MSRRLMWAVVIIAIIAGILSVIGRIQDYKVLYPMTGKIISVDRKSELITLVDGAGRMWEFYGADDWEIGDFCSCLMDNKGTENVYDDAIVRVRYGGVF